VPVPNRYRIKEDGDRILLESGDYRLLETAYSPYHGYQLFPFRMNWATDPSETINRSMTVLDNQTGLHTVRSHTDQPIQSFEMLLTLIGRDEISEFRSFLKILKGRQTPFWVPTWQADLIPTAAWGGNNVYVEQFGYIQTLYPYAARQHIAIVNHDGTIYPRHIFSYQIVGDLDRLYIEPSMGLTIYPNQCLVSFLLFARLDADTVQMKWLSNELVEVRLAFTELPNEVPIV
jgi:hypothetical protein